MYNFEYFTPTKVLFGRGTETKVGQLVAEQNCKKVLIHYGKGSVIRSGLLDRVKKSLDEYHVNYIELGGAVAWYTKGLNCVRKKALTLFLQWAEEAPLILERPSVMAW